MALIELEGVAKDFVVHRARGRFRRERITVHAVQDLTFSVERGTILGYIGPNGAGKSTTVKMLTGILVPTAGRVSVGGLVPWDERIALARRMGVMFGQRVQLWWDLPLVDSLELLRHMYRVPADRYRDTLAALREALDLDPFIRTPVRQLSLGQRIRGAWSTNPRSCSSTSPPSGWTWSPSSACVNSCFARTVSAASP